MRRSSYEYVIPALLALALTIGLGFSIPILSTKYILKLEGSEILPAEFYRHFHDVDHDGVSEIIELFYNSSGNLSVKLRFLNAATINQFNLPGILPKVGVSLSLEDINGDGITDIFVCTEKNDSIYLTIIDDIFGHPTTSRVFSLDPINQYNDYGDYSFIPGGLTDLNMDGTAEFVMAINGGHSLQPRRVYAIDYKNDSVMRSPLSGAAVHSLDFFDLDKDGREEIIVKTTATENFSDPFPYMDTTSYLMVLDQNLNFYKAPQALSQHLSWSTVEPFAYGEEHFLLIHVRSRIKENLPSVLAIVNDSLRSVRKRDVSQLPKENLGFWREPGSRDLEHLKIVSKEKLYSFDFDLKFTDSLASILPVGFNANARRFDLDGLGKEEYVIPGNYQVFVARDDLSHVTALELKWDSRNPRSFISSVVNGTDHPTLVVQMDRECFYLSYKQNAWFRFRFLLYPGIFLLLFGMFYFLGNLQNRMLRRRYEKDRLISQLQLQAIKNQLDPHFTYNALNAVGSLIYKGEKELAYQYLKGLTDLLRLVSGDTSDVTWTLNDELGFVRKFLEIEKLRFRDSFSYSMKVHDALGEMKLPKLSVLTFVENALKHGLRHKKNDRKLVITAEACMAGLKVEITDNGIGRIAAEKFRDEKSGSGLRMMKRYFKQFNEATGLNARFEVRDLYEKNNEPAGTLVEIYIA